MILTNLFRRPKPHANRAHLSAAQWPELVYAIGDVHGSLDQLMQLEQKIAADASETPGQKWIVMLGDYVDRGTNAAGTLDHLTAAAPTGFKRICLAGNHEVMMCQFLSSPDASADWLSFGGLETLSSYGISPERLTRVSKRRLHAILDSHIPQEHIAFLRNLPLTLSLPGTVFVHAGIRRENEALDRQSEDDLLWIRDEFFNAPVVNNLLVVHGHTPATTPVSLPGRICVDTAAYATGVLTAVRLTPGQVPQFLST